MLISIGDGISLEEHKLTGFYDILKSLEIMKDSELNIEAVAFSEGVLYLFNRRRNIVFSVIYNEFLQFIKTGSPTPQILSMEYDLPEINGIEAGFSGATFSRDEKTVLMTCSVEDTDNAYDDGKVLGSFIGVASVENMKIGSSIAWIALENQRAPLKIESVVIVQENNPRDLDIILVSDSDGEDSLILKGNLKW